MPQSSEIAALCAGVWVDLVAQLWPTQICRRFRQRKFPNAAKFEPMTGTRIEFQKPILSSRIGFKSIYFDGGFMPTIFFRCPSTGSDVQGWIADEPEIEDGENFQPVKCAACGRFHYVSPKSAKVLGDSRSLRRRR